jgi:hypothetical protein
MRDQINEIAAQNGRSANAEIVARLQATLAGDNSLSIEAVRQVMREELKAAMSDERLRLALRPIDHDYENSHRTKQGKKA